jgi:hypothetical protein
MASILRHTERKTPIERPYKAKTSLVYNEVAEMIYSHLRVAKRKPVHLIVSMDAYWTLYHTICYMNNGLHKEVIMHGVPIIGSLGIDDTECFGTFRILNKNPDL